MYTCTYLSPYQLPNWFQNGHKNQNCFNHTLFDIRYKRVNWRDATRQCANNTLPSTKLPVISHNVTTTAAHLHRYIWHLRYNNYFFQPFHFLRSKSPIGQTVSSNPNMCQIQPKLEHNIQINMIYFDNPQHRRFWNW